MSHFKTLEDTSKAKIADLEKGKVPGLSAAMEAEICRGKTKRVYRDRRRRLRYNSVSG